MRMFCDLTPKVPPPMAGGHGKHSVRHGRGAYCYFSETHDAHCPVHHVRLTKKVYTQFLLFKKTFMAQKTLSRPFQETSFCSGKRTLSSSAPVSQAAFPVWSLYTILQLFCMFAILVSPCILPSNNR